MLERRDLLAASSWWTAGDAGVVGQDKGEETSLTLRAEMEGGEWSELFDESLDGSKIVGWTVISLPILTGIARRVRRL
jgi:hypothetical protein